MAWWEILETRPILPIGPSSKLEKETSKSDSKMVVKPKKSIGMQVYIQEI